MNDLTLKPSIKKFRIAFVDFWPGFDPKKDPIFGKSLSKHFNIEYTLENPDLVIFSMFGNSHFRYNKPKLLYSGENYFAYKYPSIMGTSDPWKYANYVISSFDYDTDRSLVMPDWVRKYGFDSLKGLKQPQLKFEKTKFATYIQGNCSQEFRNNFVKELSKYKTVDCPGSCLNNMEANACPKGESKLEGLQIKLNFCKDYKFVFAFENSTQQGYNSEKIVEPYFSGSIPLYWGDSQINKIFNTKSMINFHDFDNMEQMIERIIEIDNKPMLYKKILEEPILNNDQVLSEQNFIDFMKQILK